MNSKIKAEGMLPKPENLKVDFIEEAESKQIALKKIKTRIDRYLRKNELQKFNNQNSND